MLAEASATRSGPAPQSPTKCDRPSLILLNGLWALIVNLHERFATVRFASLRLIYGEPTRQYVIPSNSISKIRPAPVIAPSHVLPAHLQSDSAICPVALVLWGNSVKVDQTSMSRGRSALLKV